MRTESFKIWGNTDLKSETCPWITAFLPDKKTSDAAVIIFPGGGYHCHAEHEGSAYAEFLAGHGITSFVVTYRIAPDTFPKPLIDARRSVKFVRYNAKKYGIDKGKIAVMGSSAGGHLAALVSTFTESIGKDMVLDEIEKENFLPDAQILCYPVIELVEPYGHIGSGKNLLGEDYPKIVAKITPDEIAKEGTPKAFIWHTAEDSCVNVINSLNYAKKLKTIGTPVELHIFPEGRHGLGLGEGEHCADENKKMLCHMAQWQNLLLNWIKYIGF